MPRHVFGNAKRDEIRALIGNNPRRLNGRESAFVPNARVAKARDRFAALGKARVKLAPKFEESVFSSLHFRCSDGCEA
jgi:hypothetical protein